MKTKEQILKYIESCPDYAMFVIDLFCGAGGVTSGVEKATANGVKCAKVIACVNHDTNAILSHEANHQDVLHFIEDIRTLELSPIVELVEKVRKVHPYSYILIHASAECTNFSRAKGGQPRDADSRTLAEHLYRYIETIGPDYVSVENVEEFMSWGKVDDKGKPISMDKGSSYLRWVRNIRRYGYNYDWRILNSADFGAYTSRKRFFGLFAKKGLPIAFPIQTYAKNGDDGMFRNYKKWKAVRDVLDFADEGLSIFTREKPLCEKTLERIYQGLIKFVAGGKRAFLVKYNSMNTGGHYVPPSVEEPCPTVACQKRLGIAQVNFLSKQFSGDPYGKNISVEGPSGSITTVDHHAFISAYYGNGHNHSVDTPCPTLTTKDRTAFISAYYGGANHAYSLDCPSATLTTRERLALVSPKRYIATYHNRSYLMNPQFKCAGGSIDKPCFTLIARMDKRPPYLITTDDGRVLIEIYENDTPNTIKIKKFMVMYGITDIKMRMLKISELKKIMGFPEDYVLLGSKAEQNKYIGNAVEVNMAKVLCEALCGKLVKLKVEVA